MVLKKSFVLVWRMVLKTSFLLAGWMVLKTSLVLAWRLLWKGLGLKIKKNKKLMFWYRANISYHSKQFELHS